MFVIHLQAAYEGCHEAHDEGQCLYIAERFFALNRLEHVEECLAEDGRDDHEERELCEFLLLIAEQDAGGNGRTRA